MKNISSIVWGIVLIALGLIFGLNALEITKIDIFFEGWWTLFIIIPCFIGLIKDDDKNYVIDGTSVSALEVQKYLEKMGYRDIVDIANRVSLMMKRDSFSIQSEYGYFLKVFWTHHPGHHPTSHAKKNMFNQFPQRKYSENQLYDLEHLLLAKPYK